MYWDVVDVKVAGNLLLNVRFEDGTSGRVRFAPEHLTGVFGVWGAMELKKHLSQPG